MSEWAGLSPKDVEQLATNYALTIERVRALAHERFPDDQHEAEQLIQRATQNVRNAFLEHLKECGCLADEAEAWLSAIVQCDEAPLLESNRGH